MNYDYGNLNGLPIMFLIIIIFGICVMFFNFLIYIVYPITCILSCFAFSKLLKKTGESGWKAFIPIYGKYIECKKFWNIKGFYLYIIFVFIAIIMFLLTKYIPSVSHLNIFSVFIIRFINTILIVKIGMFFNKSKSFIVWSIFFPFIFLCKLALEKVQPTNK